MGKAAWLEVALIVDGEMAEAVAEVLRRYAPEGVAIESTSVQFGDDESAGQAAGPLRVAAYLPEDERLEETRSKLEEALWYLGRIRRLPPAQYQRIEAQDWSESWKQHYKPILIGERLLVAPAWIDLDSGSRMLVRIDPGMAFGTGTHPSTRLCLEMVEASFTASPLPDAVIDLGCGSGILAIAALKLGARQALGVDIDPEAIQTAQSNAEANGVASRLELGLGSLEQVLDGQFNLQQAPLVLANILAPVLVRLFGQGLGELVSPGGSLVLSGILAEQADEVLAAGQQQGFRQVERRQEEDWVALRVMRDKEAV